MAGPREQSSPIKVKRVNYILCLIHSENYVRPQPVIIRLGTDRGVDAVPLVLRNPLLLLTSPSVSLMPSLDKAIDMMAGMSRKRMAKLLRNCPSLLTTPPQQLTAQFREIVSVLRVPPASLLDMLGRDPRLLQVSFLLVLSAISVLPIVYLSISLPFILPPFY